jgi:hypothetical protein
VCEEGPILIFVKFQSLKQELRKWEKNQNEKKSVVPRRGCDESKDAEPRGKDTKRYILTQGRLAVVFDNVPIGRTLNRPRVEGGINRTPIDRTAARVISKAPWWAIQNMGTDRQLNTHAQHPAIGENGQIESIKSGAEFTSELCQRFTSKTDEVLNKSLELYVKTMDARQAMEVMASGWYASWMEFSKTADTRLKDFRMYRMSFDTECQKLLQQLRDVRAFFLDKDYETEITRLREFVGLCERLQKLKESGFLDTVADTMLKLASK